MLAAAVYEGWFTARNLLRMRALLKKFVVKGKVIQTRESPRPVELPLLSGESVCGIVVRAVILDRVTHDFEVFGRDDDSDGPIVLNDDDWVVRFNLCEHFPCSPKAEPRNGHNTFH